MKLTTIAVYNQPVQAQIARNALEAEGIWAVIADGEIAAMDLLLVNAVGGVKVHVKEEDAARAEAFLTELYGSSGGAISLQVDEDELARQALEAAPEESEEPPPPEQTAEPLAVEHGFQDTREQYARRFLHATLFGLFMPPLFFYALYLLLNLAFGNGPLSRNGKWNLSLGLALFVPFLLLLAALTNTFGIGTLAYGLDE